MFWQTFYFLLPAIFANMAPIFFRNKWSSLAFPMDCNQKWNGKPILGNHKTFRGLIAAIILAVLVSFLQKQLWEAGLGRDLIFFNYDADWLLLGFLIGLGVMVGDSIKSFVKRRLSFKPGASFMPWDQIDWVLGCLLFVTFFITILPWQVWLYSLLIGFFGHIAVRYISYWLGINKEKW